jgi:hypothetical protein
MMVNVIELLNDKIRCLETFQAINENELVNMANGDFDGVEAFYEAREQLLRLIAEGDQKLGVFAEQESGGEWLPSTSDREEVSRLLSKKDELVQQILAQDLRILSYIEAEKNEVIRSLQEVKRAKRAMGAYRGQVDDGLIDEKA